MFDFLDGARLWENLGLYSMESIQQLARRMYLNAGLVYPDSSRFWEKVVKCRVPALAGVQEPFCQENQHLDLDIVAAFGSPTPGAEHYLLHLAPGWNSNRNRRPVLLVPGAGLDATSFTDLFAMGYTGLQQQLVALGYRVFAVTFSHLHGDNFLQAIQLADAIGRVGEMTGCEQVDVIAHSKGGMAARIYLSDFCSTPYRGDVHHYVMLGTPNLGLDLSFRNPLLNYLIYASGSSGAMAWDRVLTFGFMVNVSERSIYREGCFPGQSQMLYRWDEIHPLDQLQQDWYTTYYGGEGMISHSRGIERALANGGYLVEKLNRRGLDAGVRFSVLAGNKHFFTVIPGDQTGPGDGLVFVDSVLATEALAKNGAVLVEKAVFPVNHMELLYSRRVARWVDRQLGSD